VADNAGDAEVPAAEFRARRSSVPVLTDIAKWPIALRDQSRDLVGTGTWSQEIARRSDRRLTRLSRQQYMDAADPGRPSWSAASAGFKGALRHSGFPAVAWRWRKSSPAEIGGPAGVNRTVRDRRRKVRRRQYWSAMRQANSPEEISGLHLLQVGPFSGATTKVKISFPSIWPMRTRKGIWQEGITRDCYAMILRTRTPCIGGSSGPLIRPTSAARRLVVDLLTATRP